jgi:hypothetical protein
MKWGTHNDPDQRYNEACLELADSRRRLIDAGQGSIESRERALATLQELGQPQSPAAELLIYVPAKAPLTDEDKRKFRSAARLTWRYAASRRRDWLQSAETQTPPVVPAYRDVAGLPDFL